MMDGRRKKFIKELLQKPRLRRESGLYVVDGPKMCAEVPEELLQEIYVSEQFIRGNHEPGLMELISRHGYEVISDRDMKQISDTMTPQGIIALASQKRPKGLGSLLDDIRERGGKGLLLGLECVQDPGNMGTILRSAEAAGADAVLCDRGCADIYSPKVVRSTMGAIFRLPVLQLNELCSAVDELCLRGYSVLAAHLSGTRDYDREDLCTDTLILIGNESKGLTAELSSHASALVRIPMEGSTESLNAATAAAVMLFEAARQRRQKKQHIS